MSRRIAGEGTVRERPDGRWEARVRLPDGRRKSVFGKTAEEANGKRLDVLTSLRKGLPIPADTTTVAGFMRQWFEAHRHSIRPSTAAGYRVCIEKHIIPALGSKRLTKLAPADVQAWMNTMAQTSSPRTVQLARAVLHEALQRGLEWGDVQRNVVSVVRGPSVQREPVDPWTAEECQAFLEAMAEHRLSALWICAVTLGLRQGELLGLRWRDLDLKKNELRVIQARDRRTGAFGPPKSKQSRRVLPLPEMTAEALRAHRKRQMAEMEIAEGEWPDTGLVFVSERGTPLNGTSVSRSFNRHVVKAKLRPVRFHDLRHSCASLLLAQGVGLREIMEWLGHSGISLTANTYAHVMPAAKRAAAGQMDSAFAAKVVALTPNVDPHGDELGAVTGS